MGGLAGARGGVVPYISPPLKNGIRALLLPPTSSPYLLARLACSCLSSLLGKRTRKKAGGGQGHGRRNILLASRLPSQKNKSKKMSSFRLFYMKRRTLAWEGEPHSALKELMEEKEKNYNLTYYSK